MKLDSPPFCARCGHGWVKHGHAWCAVDGCGCDANRTAIRGNVAQESWLRNFATQTLRKWFR